MTELTKPTPTQCERFAKAIGEWHEKEFFPYVVNPTTYDSASILFKMREKLGEEKYLLFLETLVDKSKFWGWRANTLFAKVIDLFIFNPAALIDKASEYLKEKGE